MYIDLYFDNVQCISGLNHWWRSLVTVSCGLSSEELAANKTFVSSELKYNYDIKKAQLVSISCINT